MSLYKFKEIEKINAKDYSDIDKSLYSTCVYYNLTESELDNMNPKKAARKILRMGKQLGKGFNPKAVKRINRYKINYSIDKMTFGQYIEIAYFLQMGVIDAAHLILASASKEFYGFVIPEKFKILHSKKAEYFLHQQVEAVLGSVLKIVENFNTFNKQYKGLFGLKNGNEESESESEIRKIEEDPFNKQYGWIFSATQVAEHEKISLDKAFMLPVRQALNDLSYLKGLNKYKEQQLKKK